MSAASPAARATERMAAAIAEAGARARAAGRPVVASVVERVAGGADPLLALAAAGRHGAPGGLAALAAEGRFFWARPVDGFALAALGAASVVSPDPAREPDRFAAVERARVALLRDAVVDDASGGAPGAGPTLVGGASFDAAGPASARWAGFPSALFVLPRLQLAVAGGGAWLTTQLLVAPDGRPDADPAALTAAGAALVEAAASGSSGSASGGASGSASVAALAVSEPVSAERWRAAVAAGAAAVRAGAMEKVVLAREERVRAARPFDVIAALARLRAAYPQCYVFGVWRGARAFVGASPERLARLDGRAVRSSSLAGSAPRGATPAEDAANAAALVASAKDGVEHAIVTRALRGALAELCDDVEADDAPSLVTLPQVHHLHTPVRARLRAGDSLLGVVARLHPTPAVGGEPRAAALAFIREHEGMDRGWYAAPVGWVGRDAGELAVALRSAVVGGAEASLFAGCGVVGDSDPDAEYAESALKLRPMEAALAAAAEAP